MQSSHILFAVIFLLSVSACCLQMTLFEQSSTFLLSPGTVTIDHNFTVARDSPRIKPSKQLIITVDFRDVTGEAKDKEWDIKRRKQTSIKCLTYTRPSCFWSHASFAHSYVRANDLNVEYYSQYKNEWMFWKKENPVRFGMLVLRFVKYRNYLEEFRVCNWR